MKYDSVERLIENFHTVIDGYCHGISKYEGEIDDEIISILIKDIRPAFEEAIENEYQFDLLAIAEQFCEATSFKVTPESVVASLLDILPTPSVIGADEQFVLAQIIDPVDQVIPGTLDRLQWEWKNQMAA